MSGSWSSLRVRLTVLVLLAVVPSLGVILYSAWEHRRQAAREVERDALQLAVVVAADHERLIEGARQLLVGLARLPEVRKPDSRACPRLFADFLRQYRGYANLGVIGPSGDLVCSALPMLAPVNLHGGYVRPGDQRISAVLAAFIHISTLVHNLFFSRSGGSLLEDHSLEPA